MAELTLDVARRILDAALANGIEKKLKPLVITILDVRGCVKVTAAQDGTSLMRAEIAHGKAYGALALGMGSRGLFQRAQEQAYFVSAVNTMAQGRLVPVPGGVLIQDGGALLGAVGVSGDSSEPRYDGESLAQKGIVTITINYRLGIFGFFSHPELTAESQHQASGNYGLLDQIAALDWVRENIAAFGGDPGRVTIFGQSAGSASVACMMASPLAKGLFHRGIGQSGGSFGARTRST